MECGTGSMRLHNAPMGFHEGMREHRTRRGISQEELARKLGTDRRQLSRYEIGQNVPSVEVAAQIAAALGVSLGDLVQETPSHLGGSWRVAWIETAADPPNELVMMGTAIDGGLQLRDIESEAELGDAFLELREEEPGVLAGTFSIATRNLKGQALLATRDQSVRTWKGYWIGKREGTALTQGELIIEPARARKTGGPVDTTGDLDPAP